MYFITVLEYIEPDERFYCKHGGIRTWGYYKDKEDAYRAVHENRTDMRECLYDYALVEKIGEGICAVCKERQFFKWNDEKQGFFEIKEPECVKHITNFAIG